MTRSGDSDSGIAALVFWTLLALLAIVVIVAGPVLTSDGPAHVSMAHFIVRAGDPAWPMLNRLYELNPVPSPNALGDLFMAGPMLIVPPPAAEQIVQILCLVSVPLAARLVLRRLAPGSDWIALFFFPVTLQRLFFLGLYNYCLSLAGTLLCIWAYLRLRTHGSFGAGAVLATLLLLTLGCQASGWMEAVVALGTMELTETWLRWRHGERGWPLLRSPIVTVLCGTPGAALFVLFVLFGPGDHHLTYGPSAIERLTEVFRGDPFAPIGQSTALVGFVLGLTLIDLAAFGAIAMASRPYRTDPETDRLRTAIRLLPLSFLGFLLVVPDEAGGGWTHSWRAEAFPYLGLALAGATLPIARTFRRLAVLAAAIGGFVMIGATFEVQMWEVPRTVREFNEADALVGPHCTVAPVLAQFKLDPENTARLFYHPLFHLANQFESRADRPVLFSYVARLPLYMVRFRPEVDPQRFLYHWESSQRDTHVRQIDIEGFEAASGIPVDYVLLWDFPTPDRPGPYHDIRSAVTHGHYELAHRSSGGRMELYRRTGPGGCAKP